MDRTALISGILIGLVVAFIASYPIGLLREQGRRRAAGMVERREERARRRQSTAATAAAKAAAEAGAANEQIRRARIRTERVGARFIRREARLDPGMDLEVIDLDPRQPLDRVIVRYAPTPDRTPTPYDPPCETVSMEWRALAASPGEQRHRVARIIEQSLDDKDGWLQFERVVPIDV